MREDQLALDIGKTAPGLDSTSGSATSRSLLRTLPILCLLTGHMVSASSLYGTSNVSLRRRPRSPVALPG
jgi:hypothetical protein